MLVGISPIYNVILVFISKSPNQIKFPFETGPKESHDDLKIKKERKYIYFYKSHPLENIINIFSKLQYKSYNVVLTSEFPLILLTK